MAMGIFVLPMSNGAPNANIPSGEGHGYVLCSDVVDDEALVMIHADQSTIDALSHTRVRLNTSNVDTHLTNFGVTLGRLQRAFVGKSVEDEPPNYALPGSAVTPPEDLPGAASGLDTLLAGASSGQTVEVPEGTYSGDFTVPAGVTLQPETGARVVIDVLNEFDMRGATVCDIELLSLNPDRSIKLGSITMSAANTYMYGCIVHDMHGSGVYWMSAGVGAIVDCLFFNNGYRDGGFGRGHAIYSHNHNGGARLIHNNILLGGLSGYTLHVYSGTTNQLRDYTVTHNVGARSKMIVGGGGGIYNLEFTDNVQHGASIILNASGPDNDAVVEGNRLSGGAVLSINNIDDLTQSDNEAVTTETVFIEPCTQSSRWLAFVTIMNPEQNASVSVDLSSLELDAGDYTLINAQNIAEAHEFTISESQVTEVAMSGWTAAERIGEEGITIATTFPDFGIFILASV